MVKEKLLQYKQQLGIALTAILTTGGISTATLPLNYNAETCWNVVEEKFEGYDIRARTHKPFLFIVEKGDDKTFITCSMITGEIVDEYK